MRALLLSLLTGCGRISFDILGAGIPDDAAEGDGPAPGDSQTQDGPAADGPTQVRACHTDPNYQTSAGLANTYREGVELVSWTQARLNCMAEDADLWVVESALEQNSLCGDWTGISDTLQENVWRKLDGTVATFLPFQAGEPDGGASDDCIRNDSAGFEDRDCTDQRDYVCECPAP